MKKVGIFVSLVVVLAACAAPPTNREAAMSETNREQASPVATVSDADAIAREQKVWEEIKKKDYEGFARYLADDQIEVTETGVMDRAGTIASVKTLDLTEMNFSDWKVAQVNPELTMVIYTVALKGKSEGKDFPPGSHRASSAWLNRNGKWQAIYHQSTPVETAPASTAASPSAAKPAASPAMLSSPAAATSDPVANEKLIWSFLKSKNYDAFAALLDAKAIEVEPPGVFDKDGTIQGVKEFDASKAELSGFKTMNLGKDAALVTYVVKNPGQTPDTEFHTTIWGNRDGKWLAAFHQGTPAPKK